MSDWACRLLHMHRRGYRAMAGLDGSRKPNGRYCSVGKTSCPFYVPRLNRFRVRPPCISQGGKIWQIRRRRVTFPQAVAVESGVAL